MLSVDFFLNHSVITCRCTVQGLDGSRLVCSSKVAKDDLDLFLD
jgi:hypothetical protein